MNKVRRRTLFGLVPAAIAGLFGIKAEASTKPPSKSLADMLAPMTKEQCDMFTKADKVSLIVRTIYGDSHVGGKDNDAYCKLRAMMQFWFDDQLEYMQKLGYRDTFQNAEQPNREYNIEKVGYMDIDHRPEDEDGKRVYSDIVQNAYHTLRVERCEWEDEHQLHILEHRVRAYAAAVMQSASSPFNTVQYEPMIVEIGLNGERGEIRFHLDYVVKTDYRNPVDYWIPFADNHLKPVVCHEEGIMLQVAEAGKATEEVCNFLRADSAMLDFLRGNS